MRDFLLSRCHPLLHSFHKLRPTPSFHHNGRCDSEQLYRYEEQHKLSRSTQPCRSDRCVDVIPSAILLELAQLATSTDTIRFHCALRQPPPGEPDMPW